jgi:hypothetical protein
MITPLLVTPTRRAIWNRERAENHLYFRELLKGAIKDYTSSPKYASNGRWSALGYQKSGDVALARRAYEHVRAERPGGTFAAAPVLTGNHLREAGAEFVLVLTWVADQLTPVELAAWRDWLFRSANATLLSVIRMNDSDQVVGTFFFLACLDRVFGSSYLTHPQALTMRAAVRKFCAVFGEGGQWPEGSEYSLGTMNLLFTGAEAVGFDDYPEIAAFRDQLIQYLPHTFVPGLRDTFEHGDDQTPHDPRWLALETILAYLAQYAPAIRQFDADLRVVWKRPAGTPFYPRFFYWADPYGPAIPWQPTAGTYAVSPGVGQVLSRTGWEASAAAIHLWFPPYSLGTLDHAYGIFGELRMYDRGAWVRDRPIAYSGSLLLGNHTLIAGLPAPKEIGVFNGETRLGDRVTYGSGTNAGVYAAPGRAQPPLTFLYEKTVSYVWLMELGVVLQIVRVHLADVRDLTRFAETVDDPTIEGALLINTLWQSQGVVRPTVLNGVITDNGRVEPLYPCTITVVDEGPLALGTITAGERGFYASVVPTTVSTWQILVTLIGEADVTIEPLGDVQRIRVHKSGHRDVVLYSSARPGPALTTSTFTNTHGGKTVVHDPTKIAGILAARAVTIDPAWADAAADVYVELPTGLHELGAAPPVSCEEQLRVALLEIARLRGAA